MIIDRKLTEHFSLYDLTKTNKVEFQEENRNLSPLQITKLEEVANLLEHIWFILDIPLVVNSGYRCKPLNDAVGSTDRSQHLLCEAADITPLEYDLGAAFRRIWRDVKDRGANVGQLIYETDQRGYPVTSWIHISLGAPWRDAEKCKQILRMENGKYTRLA